MEEKVEQLEHNLKIQAELYRSLLGLAKQQAQEISPDNLDVFMSVLEQKKTIIEKIGEIETEIRPLRDYWESHKEEAEEKDRRKLRSVVDEIRAVLEELLEVESRSQKELGSAMDTVEEQIRQLSVGPDALRSYTKGEEEKPRFMDEVG
jgi:hypothetical protein